MEHTTVGAMDGVAVLLSGVCSFDCLFVCSELELVICVKVHVQQI